MPKSSVIKFGKIFKVLGNFFEGQFGKILGHLWQILYAIGKIGM